MPKGTCRRWSARKPGLPRRLRPRTVRQVLCQKGRQCERKRRTRYQKRKQRRKTRRRQKGGQVDEPGCKRRGEGWKWVPGARSAEFDRYYDCDLAVPGPGGCCRKMAAGQEKCPVCLDVFPRSEMMPKNHPHKTCADCWAAIGTNQCPVCREQVGERRVPANDPEPDFVRLQHGPIRAPRRPIAPAAAPIQRQEPEWVRQVVQWIEMEQEQEERQALAQQMRDAADREAAEMDRMRDDYDPLNPGGGRWWWPF
jgi:hypothetical protein